MKHIVYLLMLFFPICLAFGQQNSTFIQEKIDSLDKKQCYSDNEIKGKRPRGCAYVIKVKNQSQFNKINDDITKAIAQGKKNIKVEVGSGVYHFRENHIMRMHEKNPEVSITITGKNAVITSGVNYKDDESESSWCELSQAENLIKLVDEKSKLCFIPFKNDIPSAIYSNYTKVQVTQWYNCFTYEIHHLDSNGIYFSVPKLSRVKFAGREGLSINYDYLYQGIMPRFRLYDQSKEREYSASRFVALSGCDYNYFCIKGLRFSGNKSGIGLITINFCDIGQLEISGCTFDSIQSSVAGIEGTDNVLFENNKVRNIKGGALSFTRGCNHIRVTNNLFENCGLGLQQNFCVKCGEAEYYIAENTFRDFGYGAIGVGVWYGNEKKKYSGGIVEHNEIYFTPKYFADALKHMLMDSGAIYTWTQNDDVIIRYNYIHDYTGAGDNRGIFCDDGAANLKIYGNVVLNIPNCYNIDSRAVKDLVPGGNNNSNNFMAANIVDGSVRFMGYGQEKRRAIKGANFLLKRNADNKYRDNFENLDRMEEDVKGELFYVSDPWLKRRIKNN